MQVANSMGDLEDDVPSERFAKVRELHAGETNEV
jgi:hypothetical protein